MMSSVEAWVDEVARTTRPDRVVWCDGSDAENDRLVDQMVSDGTLIRLNQDTLPDCFLHRSNPQDVARTEHLTFICSDQAEDAGPTNNWMSPAEPPTHLAALQQQHARPNDVRGPVSHGSAVVALRQGRR
jgi:phosphoenolpyruvate carboxykinase (GTP)